MNFKKKMKWKPERTRLKAMALWEKRYGQAERAKDFAGREMEKGAYNDRSSEYSWNLDHMLPRSLGGKSIDSNLVCCNMRTNDEKAASFPCFATNGIRFRVRMKQGRCEIEELRMELPDGRRTA